MIVKGWGESPELFEAWGGTTRCLSSLGRSDQIHRPTRPHIPSRSTNCQNPRSPVFQTPTSPDPQTPDHHDCHGAKIPHTPRRSHPQASRSPWKRFGWGGSDFLCVFDILVGHRPSPSMCLARPTQNNFLLSIWGGEADLPNSAILKSYTSLYQFSDAIALLPACFLAALQIEDYGVGKKSRLRKK